MFFLLLSAYLQICGGRAAAIPLVPSSGSLSVPLVSSVDVSEKQRDEEEEEEEWRNGKDLRRHNQMQTVGLCFVISGFACLQLVLCVPSKAGYFHPEAQLNLIEVLMWLTFGRP